MGIEFNPKNLNAAEIFDKLDAADGKKNGKIDKSIWNAFAEAAGGNKIKNFIEEKNAVASIGRYLAKASDDVKQRICDYLGNVNTVKSEGVTEDSVNPSLSSQEETKLAKINSGYRQCIENIKKRASKTETLEDYGFTGDDLSGGAISLNHFGYDSNGEFVDKFKPSTTEAERKVALKAKGSHGYSYVKAKAVVRDVKNKFKKEWKKLSFANEIAYADRVGGVDPERVAQYKRELWEKRVFPEMSSKYPADAAKYKAAMEDIKQLEEKYPKIGQCYEDLQEMVLRHQVI